MKTLFFILLLPCLILSKEPAELIRVVDGDTIQVLYNGKKEKVRLLCVDTPESVHPKKEKNTKEGDKAKRALKEKLLKTIKIELEFEKNKRDRYGRLLAYVWVNKEMINIWIIKNGHSKYYTKYGKSKLYHKEFSQAQSDQSAHQDQNQD